MMVDFLMLWERPLLEERPFFFEEMWKSAFGLD